MWNVADLCLGRTHKNILNTCNNLQYSSEVDPYIIYRKHSCLNGISRH